MASVTTGKVSFAELPHRSSRRVSRSARGECGNTVSLEAQLIRAANDVEAPLAITLALPRSQHANGHDE
jgi:hypothetical protein